jgi:hypothetical protein
MARGKSFVERRCKKQLAATKIKMAGAAGLEPVTSAVTGQRSNQLSYAPAMGTLTINNARVGVKLWFEH